eukprot:SAG31_NODE_23450_length_504_cov_0.765432_1_plen_94_part_00
MSGDDPEDPGSGFLDGEISYHSTGSAKGFILKDGTEHVGTESNLGIDGEPSDKHGNRKRWNDNPNSWQTAPTSLAHYQPVPYEGLGGKFPKYG